MQHIRTPICCFVSSHGLVTPEFRPGPPSPRGWGGCAEHVCCAWPQSSSSPTFSNFEGWPEGSQQRRDAFARAEAWIDIMEAVGTDLLQVGSSDSPDMTQDVDRIIADLAQLADMLATRGFRIAYENWCWATCAPRWKDVWATVKKADRPNISLCLDTFQTAGGEWGDPATKSGRIEAGGIMPEELSREYAASLDELSRTVPGQKIYFLQISDAYRLEVPMESTASPDSGLRPRGRWIHQYQPLPFDGGYLPAERFVRAVLATGFDGWLSIEVFDGKFEEKWR
ncbi:xylose isomerase-like protein [Chaetomium sp. MPI-CAGE-AT-0009]|nr:xylose isomerase-like protein [Chaetomium sp. MPI-CAGE-AT-0009]